MSIFRFVGWDHCPVRKTARDNGPKLRGGYGGACSFVAGRTMAFQGRRTRRPWKAIVLAALVILLGGCWQDMANQPRYEPLEASDFFVDGLASRPPVPGAVARGDLRIDNHLYLGKNKAGKPATTFPMAVNEKLLARGRERYNIFCANCHDRVGNGQGMVVRRGFPRPPSLHIERLQKAPVGYFFDVITKGFGRMPSLAPQIPPKDRWAIIAYVRALQLSQHAERDVLTQEDLRRLDNGSGQSTNTSERNSQS